MGIFFLLIQENKKIDVHSCVSHLEIKCFLIGNLKSGIPSASDCEVMEESVTSVTSELTSDLTSLVTPGEVVIEESVVEDMGDIVTGNLCVGTFFLFEGLSC